MGDKMLTAAEVTYLASIPPKEVLLGKLVGQLAAPIQNLHYLLSSPIRGLLYTLQARVQQLEGDN